jgi:hypothetical protein
VASYSDEELRFEIQKQMGDCVVSLGHPLPCSIGIDKAPALVIMVRWPDGAQHLVVCTDRGTDGWQSRFIAAAVSKLTAWRDIQVLEGNHHIQALAAQPQRLRPGDSFGFIKPRFPEPTP